MHRPQLDLFPSRAPLPSGSGQAEPARMPRTPFGVLTPVGAERGANHPPEPPPVRANLEQLRALDAQLAAAGPPRALTPPAAPALHRRAILPSVASAEARASRVAQLLAELGPTLDDAGRWLAERLGGLTVETLEAGDLTYLEVVIDACRVEGAPLGAVLAKGRHDGPVKFARNRAFCELYLLTRCFATVARIWACNHTSVRDGVHAHEARMQAEAAAELETHLGEEEICGPPATAPAAPSRAPGERYFERDTDPPPPPLDELPARARAS